MPTFINGSIGQQNLTQCYALCFTSNGVIKANGDLTMGAGFAKQVAQWFPASPKLFGQAIVKATGTASTSRYELMIVDLTTHAKPHQLIAFQTKLHWRDAAIPSLIGNAARRLASVAAANPDRLYFLNYPGIGLGGLQKDEVEWRLKCLPFNVHIFSR